MLLLDTQRTLVFSYPEILPHTTSQNSFCNLSLSIQLYICYLSWWYMKNCWRLKNNICWIVQIYEFIGLLKKKCYIKKFCIRCTLLPHHTTLLENQSKYPRYNVKCRGKQYTTWNIVRIVSRFPRYISCYIAESGLPLGQCIHTHTLFTRVREF